MTRKEFRRIWRSLSESEQRRLKLVNYGPSKPTPEPRPLIPLKPRGGDKGPGFKESKSDKLRKLNIKGLTVKGNW